MSAPCVICTVPTDSIVLGSIGAKTGVMCEDCQLFCDGNIVTVDSLAFDIDEQRFGPQD